MSNTQRVSLSTSNNIRSGKNSLTFENVVCTQLELQRRAASFSHRRNTMCRPSSHPRLTLLTPLSSTSISTEISNRFLKRKYLNTNQRNRTLSSNSIYADRFDQRPSSMSMFFWDTSSRNENNKKVRIFFIDEKMKFCEIDVSRNHDGVWIFPKKLLCIGI